MKGQKSNINEKLKLDITYWVTMLRLIQMGIPWEVCESLSLRDLNMVIATSTSMSEVGREQSSTIDLDTNYAAMAKQFGR